MCSSDLRQQSSQSPTTRQRSYGFDSFSRSDSEEDPLPAKPRGPPLRNVEIRSRTSSYDARTSRSRTTSTASNKLCQAHVWGPCNGLMISNCTEGQAPLPTACSCGGHGNRGVAAEHQAANTQTASAELMAQLQALIGKIHAQTGQLVVPKLNVHMKCEVSETTKEIVEMEVDVRLKYVSAKAIEQLHVGPCTQLREFLGVGSACAVMEGLLQT